MALEKVTPGTRVRLGASAWNAMIDAAVDFQTRQSRADEGSSDLSNDTGIVLVKNDSGGSVPRFGVLGIDSILIAPSDNLGSFQERFCLVGVTPTVADHAGRFVVTLDPLADGAIGRAYAQAVCAVKIESADTVGGTGAADVLDGETGKLTMTPGGSAQVLYREAGSGAKWAVVRLGNAPGYFPVFVAVDGGADGDGTTQASWTYLASLTPGGDLIGMDLDPLMPMRPAYGRVDPAPDDSEGIARWDENGDMVLVMVGERVHRVICGDEGSS